MKKLLLLIIPLLIVLSGCNTTDKIYLNDKYYNKGEYIEVTEEDIEKLNNDSYVLFTYNHYCNFSIPCDEIFEEVMQKYKIDFLKISIDHYKNTTFFEKVRYAPSILVIKNNKIIAYLDANSDDDYNKYQDTNEFDKWLNTHVYTSKK